LNFNPDFGDGIAVTTQPAVAANRTPNEPAITASLGAARIFGDDGGILGGGHRSPLRGGSALCWFEFIAEQAVSSGFSLVDPHRWLFRQLFKSDKV
jgi:hypothetical protein